MPRKSIPQDIETSMVSFIRCQGSLQSFNALNHTTHMGGTSHICSILQLRIQGERVKGLAQGHMKEGAELKTESRRPGSQSCALAFNNFSADVQLQNAIFSFSWWFHHSYLKHAELYCTICFFSACLFRNSAWENLLILPNQQLWKSFPHMILAAKYGNCHINALHSLKTGNLSFQV